MQMNGVLEQRLSIFREKVLRIARSRIVSQNLKMLQSLTFPTTISHHTGHLERYENSTYHIIRLQMGESFMLILVQMSQLMLIFHTICCKNFRDGGKIGTLNVCTIQPNSISQITRLNLSKQNQDKAVD